MAQPPYGVELAQCSCSDSTGCGAAAGAYYSFDSAVFCWRRLRWISLVVHDCAQTAVI